MVFKAFDPIAQKTVAIKKVRLEHCKEGIPQTTLREISFLKEFKHENIVKFNEIHLEGQKIYLNFEFVHTDLKKLLNSRGYKHFKEEESLHFIK